MTSWQQRVRGKDDPRGAYLLLTSWQRWLWAGSAVPVAVLLAIAWSLTPATEGFGTHQQLGLPPCTSIVLWSMRCPGCGMTTSWAWTMRGEFLAAIEANAGGTMLALIALAYIPTTCYFSLLGRTSRRSWFSTYLAIALLVSLAIATIQWLIWLSL